MNYTLTHIVLLFFPGPVALRQTSYRASDSSTLKYLRHKGSCFCGTVQICSGDNCGRTWDYELDDDIAVELRDKNDTTLDTQKAVVEMIEEQGTTKKGVSQPAIIFPSNYSHKRNKLGDTVYMLEPTCPR